MRRVSRQEAQTGLITVFPIFSFKLLWWLPSELPTKQKLCTIDPRLEPVGEPYELAFDEHGNLF